MSIEQQFKALKAFWCMYESAAEDGREVNIYKKSIYIYPNEEEKTKRSAPIGHISWSAETTKIEVPRFLFGTKTVYKTEITIRGYVINISKDKTFNFLFFTPEIVSENVIKMGEIYEEENKRVMKENDIALDELLCDKK